MPTTRPTTLLAHHAPGGFHYDWLIDPPPSPGDAAPPGLWTARVSHPWTVWPRQGAFDAVALPPHRRRYLDWAGTLTGGRGHVHPAARGRLLIHTWSPVRIRATLIAGPLILGLQARRQSPHDHLWRIRRVD